MQYRPDCTDFNGYKPCRPGRLCDGCLNYRPRGYRILIINLDALGDVLMTTAFLPTIKSTHPQSTITWITSPAATSLLEHNPFVDEVIPYSLDLVSYLPHLEFDLVLSVDRDRKSTALAMSAQARQKRGFALDPTGAIGWFNPEFEYAYRLGVDDDLKFRRNRQTGQQILAEGMGFLHRRNDYILVLTAEEEQHVRRYREELGLTDEHFVLAVNTGCSAKFKNKKLPFDHQITVLKKILDRDGSADLRILLVGGKAETELNSRIRETIGDPRVFETPTTEGIRRGLHYIAAGDACLTGDTFGMHAAIALKVPVSAYFTLSCDVEIDLYERGELMCADVPCRPCWKPDCGDPYCLDRIDLDALTDMTWRVLLATRSR